MADDDEQNPRQPQPPTVTLHIPLEAVTIVDDVVLYTLTVEQWREWLPALEAQLDGLPLVEFEVRGAG